jgi:hypothetical protein
MTQYIRIVALMVSIYSCGNWNENSNNDKTLETIEADTIIPFHGFWATEKYIHTLIKTKSPRQSQDDGEFFQIPLSNRDRAFPCVYHEGGPDFHVVKHNNSYFLKADDNKTDSTEIIITANGSKMKIGDQIYVKTKENGGIPEDLLFKGQYNSEDKSVTLNGDGTIVGLDGINYYSVENDYIGPGMDNVDILYFGKTKTEKRTHCFEFKADTLLIYNIVCKETDDNGNCLDIQKGQLKLKLIKK